MGAITTTSTSARTREQWKMLGGDRFYTFARWLIIVLLFSIAPILSGSPVWPVTLESPPIIAVFWAYTAFSVLATAALFVPLFSSFLSLAYIFDITFISLMAFFGGERSGIFFPLYLLPLISAALRQSPAVSLLSGIVASLFYITAFLSWRQWLASEVPFDVLEYVSLGLRGLTLTFIPWLTSGLSERWSETNRRSVVVAEQQAEDSLREARAYRDQMQSLYEVAYSLSTTMDYRHVLESTLHESRRLVPYKAGLILLSSGRQDELYVAAGNDISPSDTNRTLTITKDGLGVALRSPDAKIISDVRDEPDLDKLDTLSKSRSICLVPLRANLQTYGLMAVAADATNAFSREQLDMLTALSSYAVIALHNAQLLFDLKEERNKLISKEEEVRHQLARDLHDGPAQALAAITMNIEFIKRLLERDPERVDDELEKLSMLSKRTTYEVRTMLFELRPLVLETQGLRETLEQYLERFKANNANGTEILLDMSSNDDVTLDTKTEGTLFNIVQEAVNNALKHARARHIWVRLWRDGSQLHTVVQDDGIGFDKAKVLRSYEKRGSFGLLNIDERARLVNGHAEMDSELGRGTTVTIIVPIDS